MSRTRVKICGLTCPEDATAAVRAGADAVGVVFAEGPRQVDLARARETLAVVPKGVTRVGVFVDSTADFVERAVVDCGLGEVQFHGRESAEECLAAPVPVVKSFSVHQSFGAAGVDAYKGAISAALLDTHDVDKRGGTGRTFAWEAVGSLPQWLPIVIAGGLDPHNVAAAIEYFQPFGVDVSTSVEEFPGRKDRHLMAAFVVAVRDADRRLDRTFA